VTESPYLRIVPVYEGQDVRWGLEPLVGMIDRSARQVRRQHPDSVLSVGHLSRRGGGEIDRHASHESGRDADIGFYIVNDQKKPVYEQHFVAFDAEGKSKAWPGAHFDDARNWALVASLVSDPVARVTHIFVAAPLRARLMGYAERMGVPSGIRSRVSAVLAQPHGALPHDDHFHVRIACPSHMHGCIEQPQAHHEATAIAHAGASRDAHKGSSHAHESAGSTAIASAPSAKQQTHARPSHEAAKTDDKKADHNDRDAKRDQAEEAQLPTLAPEVVGLDSVVIPTPLRQPIDDVDGDLEK
jgi:penicillin-insensitive murein endopeptidase